MPEITITHRTTYRYRRDVSMRPHRLLVRPRGSYDLTVAAFDLEFAPRATVTWTQDVYGNLIAIADFADAASELNVLSRSVLQQSAPEWPTFRIAPYAHNYPFAYTDDDIEDLAPLLGRSRTEHSIVDTWARGFVAGEQTDTLSLLKDVNSGMLGRIAYRIRDEEGTQSPTETLALESGSCRDIAALFIDAVRSLGFAARAVSGYLSDTTMQNADGGSTHAWAEVFLPEAGWIAFDPTHGRIGNAHLVPVAIGRCNAQIMPITGGYLGAPDDFIDMQVSVEVTSG